jgi:hypothetical protein
MTPWRRRGLPQRPGLLVLVLAAVLLLHTVLLLQVDRQMRAGAEAADQRPPRLMALYVRSLTPGDAPAFDVAPVVALPAAPRRTMALGDSLPLLPIPAIEIAASTPAAEDSLAAVADAPETESQAETEPEPSLAAASAPAVTPLVVASAASASSAASTQPFDWPPSTRLRYVLTGNYRGPIDGSAQVEWVRQGNRYQVHLDVAIGLRFAPLISREMSSDGELGPTGLVPRRYDERTRVLLGSPQLATLRFDGQQVWLANGRRMPQPAGVQDSVSQFVQLTWRFLQQPALLQAGQRLDVPLALPRRVATWVYEVQGPETLATPVGLVETVHVQPRPGSWRPGELAAEMWFAPSLQYLPVRIRIRQTAENYVDLLIDQLPQQALPAVSLPLQR